MVTGGLSGCSWLLVVLDFLWGGNWWLRVVTSGVEWFWLVMGSYWWFWVGDRWLQLITSGFWWLWMVMG